MLTLLSLPPTHPHPHTTTTEDAMDSIIPCVAEEWFRPVLQQHSKFGNASKLAFRYSGGQ